MNGPGVVGPGALAPVTEAAGLEQQKVQQGLLVGRRAGDGRVCGHLLIECLVEPRAQLVHRLQNIVVALHPAEVVGPGRTFHRKTIAGGLERGDGGLDGFRCGGLTDRCPETLLLHRLDHRKPVAADTGGIEQFQVFAAVDGHAVVAVVPDPLIRLLEGGGELIHHHAAVLAVSDLAHQRRDGDVSQLLALQSQCLVAGLHLADQLGVGALGFDQGRDAHGVAAAVAGGQLIRQVLLALAERFAAEGLHAVFLHQQPAVTAVLQGADEFVEGVRVIGQMHLRWREAPHPLQRLGAEQSRELMLPGADLQLQIRDRRGGRDGMAPERAEPLHMALHHRIAGQVA